MFKLRLTVHKSLVPVCSHSLSIREKVCCPLTNPLQKQIFVIRCRQGQVGDFRAGLSTSCLRHDPRWSCVRCQAPRTSHLVCRPSGAEGSVQGLQCRPAVALRAADVALADVRTGRCGTVGEPEGNLTGLPTGCLSWRVFGINQVGGKRKTRIRRCFRLGQVTSSSVKY